MKRVPWAKVLPRWIGFYAAIFLWEFFTIPSGSHSDSWQGVSVSLLALPVGAYFLARVGARPGTSFVYGCLGTLLFVPRFLLMDRFSLWLQYQAPSNLVIVFSWIAFALAMGGVSSLAAQFEPVSKNRPA